MKSDPQLLSQYGRTYNCLRRSRDTVHDTGTPSKQETISTGTLWTYTMLQNWCSADSVAVTSADQHKVQSGYLQHSPLSPVAVSSLSGAPHSS